MPYPLRLRRRHSLQKCWAALLASIVLLFTCQPVAYFYHLSERRTSRRLQFFAGIMSLASSETLRVREIVFIASTSSTY
ncbi:hypothetical protein ACNKHU_08340 [Shigella flexneri]